MHNFPSRSSRLPGFAERCGVGVSWSGRRRSHPRGFGSPLTITSVLPPNPAPIPRSLGERGCPAARRNAAASRAVEFPDNEGEGRRRAGTVTQTPPPTSLPGCTGPAALQPPCRPGDPARGAPGERGCLEGPKQGCPPARARSPRPFRRAQCPQPRRGHRRVGSVGPSAARTPTWSEQRHGRLCGARREEARRADGRAGWPGSGGAGAACAEPRSPAPTAVAAAVLRLQWSAAPQPLLSHGRGALAGRCSRLPAPGIPHARLAGVEPRVAGAPVALPPCLGTPPVRGEPSFGSAGSRCLGAPRSGPGGSPWCPETTARRP